jgi:hypothetical protein
MEMWTFLFRLTIYGFRSKQLLMLLNLHLPVNMFIWFRLKYTFFFWCCVAFDQLASCCRRKHINMLSCCAICDMWHWSTLVMWYQFFFRWQPGSPTGSPKSTQKHSPTSDILSPKETITLSALSNQTCTCGTAKEKLPRDRDSKLSPEDDQFRSPPSQQLQPIHSKHHSSHPSSYSAHHHSSSHADSHHTRMDQR